MTSPETPADHPTKDAPRGALARVRADFATSEQALRRIGPRYTPGRIRREARALGRLVGRLPDGARLDVACGTGTLGMTIAAGQRLIGVDASEDMVRIARGDAAYADAVVASADRLPFAAAAFRSATVIRLLHHLDADGRRAILRELHRVVAGPIVVTFFDSATLAAWKNRARRRVRGSRHAISVDTFRADALAAGWRVDSTARTAWRFSEQIYALLRHGEDTTAP